MVILLYLHVYDSMIGLKKLVPLSKQVPRISVFCLVADFCIGECNETGVRLLVCELIWLATSETTFVSTPPPPVDAIFFVD